MLVEKNTDQMWEENGTSRIGY